MPELNPEHVKAVLRLINKGPYFQLLSMPVTDMGKGYSVVEMDLEEKHLNPFGGVHGGVYSSAIDTAAYWAIYCELDEDAGLISMDLKVDYLAPMKKGKLIARGRQIRIGKSTCLAEATAVDQQGKWLAHGTSKMMITKGHQMIDYAVRFTKSQEVPPKFI